MKIKEVNLGSFILKLLNEKGISKAEFADKLNIRRQNVNRDVFEKESLDTRLVRNISEYLDYNLFSLFVDDNQKDYHSEIKARLVIEMGEERQEKNVLFTFGKHKVVID